MDNIEVFTNDVLTIEEMGELEQLGFDVSDASCIWVSIQDRDYNPTSWLPIFRGSERLPIEVLRDKFPLTYREGNIFYCYTMSDIIRKLPKSITVDDSKYFLLINMESNIVRYSLIGESGTYIETCGDDERLITSLFKMLKKIKEYGV